MLCKHEAEHTDSGTANYGLDSGKILVENGKTVSVSFSGYDSVSNGCFIAKGTVKYEKGGKNCRFTTVVTVGEEGARVGLSGKKPADCEALLGFTDVDAELVHTEWKRADKAVAKELKGRNKSFKTKETSRAGRLYSGTVKFGSYGAVTVSYRTVSVKTGNKSKNKYSASGTAYVESVDEAAGEMTLVVPVVFTKPSKEYFDVRLAVDLETAAITGVVLEQPGQ